MVTNGTPNLPQAIYVEEGQVHIGIFIQGSNQVWKRWGNIMIREKMGKHYEQGKVTTKLNKIPANSQGNYV